jgi:DDE superfamily endonuclease
VTGEHHAKRLLHGALNVKSGEGLVCITHGWNHEAPQAFLHMIRRHWRGWNLVLFEDRGSPHTAAASRRQAKALRLEVRFLPRATPELHAMAHLWRHAKGRGLANRAAASIDTAADAACQYLLAMSRRERLRKAGILSGTFWLAT